MVWTHYKAQWTLQDYSPRNGSGKKKTRQTRKNGPITSQSGQRKLSQKLKAVAHNRELWAQLVQQSLTVAPLQP